MPIYVIYYLDIHSHDLKNSYSIYAILILVISRHDTIITNFCLKLVRLPMITEQLKISYFNVLYLRE
jgi:hypothetical protein